MVNIGYTVKLVRSYRGDVPSTLWRQKGNQKGLLKEVKFPHYRRAKQKIIKKKIMQVPGKRDITSQKQKINFEK